MFTKAANSTPVAPSRNALRTLRHLALAGTTFGGLCAVALITYDSHRRVGVAQKIIENKRTLQTSAPNYRANASARHLAAMMEAAEAGEFMGLESLKNRQPRQADGRMESPPEPDELEDSSPPRSLPSTKRSNYKIPPVPEPNYATYDLNVGRTRQNRDVMAEYTHDEGDMSMDAQIRELLLQNREIEATNVFMDMTSQREGLSFFSDRRQLACQLFTANCVKGNIYIARSLFERLEQLTTIDSELWAMMMHILAKEGHVESVGRIFEKYKHKLDVPVHLLEIVLRCLLESRRLNLAKSLFYSRIRHDQDCGMCGAFLDGLWRKTRRSELIVDEFREILKALARFDREPSEKLFNPLVKCYIEAGKIEDAEALVEDMPKKWGVEPGCRTLGLLLYGRALLCDWDGVMTGLREMHSLGFTQEKRNFAIAFDRLLLEYYPSHSGRQVYDFIIGCMNEFEIRPDLPLHRHILEALIERGDATMVKHITQMAEAQKWETGLDQQQLLQIMKARRVSMQETPVGLWRMIQAARRQHGLVATSRRLLGSSAECYGLDQDVLAPIHLDAKEKYSQSVDNMMKKRSIDVYIPLRKRMEMYIHAGKFSETVKMFRTAEANGHTFKTIHFQLVVIATILDDAQNGIREARQIIKNEWPYWFKLPTIRYTQPRPRFMPIFFQQLMQVKLPKVRDGTLIKLALFEFCNVCAENPGFRVKNHAPASVAKRLILKERPFTAILVLRAIYLSKWRKIHGFDQVLLKLLLRAYAHVCDARGVWWCMMAVLSRHESISRDFCAEVERLMPGLEKKLTAMDSDSEYPNQDNVPVLTLVADVLGKKASGDPYWSQFKANPEYKRKVRAQPVTRDRASQKFLPWTPMETMIREFDEELEFDLLARDQHYSGDPDELAYVWSEKVVPFQNRLLPEHVDYPDTPHFQAKRAPV